MAILKDYGVGDVLSDVFGGGGGLGDQLFGSAGNDPALTTALPAESNLRNKLSFANLRISFPTTGGTIPLANTFSATSISFPAYITTLTDSFTPSFTPNRVYGRTDPIPTYSGTSRSIQVSLTIPCFDADDANQNMKKINQFIKNIYPTYNKINGDLIIGSPPLVRVKFANLIVDHRFSFRGLLGYINNFSYSFDPKEGFFFDRDGAGASNLFFRSYTISFTMNVLHESPIGYINGAFESNSSDYPYRVKKNILEPVQTNNESRKGISFDLSEAKILS